VQLGTIEDHHPFAGLIRQRGASHGSRGSWPIVAGAAPTGGQKLTPERPELSNLWHGCNFG
jgi:hypothetical protein